MTELVIAPDRRPTRSKLRAGALGVTLGALGAHRWYLGYRRTALIQAVLTIVTLGIGGLWGITEGLAILAGRWRCDAQGRRLSYRTTSHVPSACVRPRTAYWHGRLPPWLVTTVVLLSMGIHLPVAAMTILLGSSWLGISLHPRFFVFPPPPDRNTIQLQASFGAVALDPIEVTIDALAHPAAGRRHTVDEQTTAMPLMPCDQSFDIRRIPVTQAGVLPSAESRAEVNDREFSAPAQLQVAGRRRAELAEGEPPDVSPLAALVDAPRRVKQQTRDARSAKVSLPSVPSPASDQHSGNEDSPPQRIYSPLPEYPPQAVAARLMGRVVLRVTISPDGRVTEISVHHSSGHELLDQAAMRAVRRWRFDPQRVSKGRQSWTIDVPIRFGRT